MGVEIFYKRSKKMHFNSSFSLYIFTIHYSYSVCYTAAQQIQYLSSIFFESSNYILQNIIKYILILP